MRKLYTETLLTALLLLCSTVASAHDFEVDGIYYNIANSSAKTVAVTYKGSNSSEFYNEYSGDITIPASVTYNGTNYSVTSIGNSAFSYCDSLANVTIPNSVTTIGNSAFQKCSALQSISIPASVTGIGNWVFSGCTSLQDVTFEDGSTELNLGDCRYSDGVGGGLFEYSPVKNVYIGRNLSYYAYSTRWCCAPFARYSANNYAPLEKAIIGPQVTNVPDYLFQDCKYLKTIISYIPASNLPTFDSYGEYFTPADVTLYVPIGEKETYENTEDWNKFGNINEMITIGDFVYGFLSQEEGTLSVIEYKGNSTEVQIPEKVNILGQKYTVVEIGNGVFYNKSDISSFKIPDTVYKISEGALDGTAWWNNQPDGVVYAGKVLYKYKGTVPLNTSIVVEEGTKGITAGAFKDQRLGTLTSITIPGSLRFIGDGAFSLSDSNYAAPIKVSISDLSAWCNIDFGNYYANPLCNYDEGLYLNEEKITELTIPGDITEVKEYVFCGTYFTKVTIPSSVTSIGNYAFGSIGNLYIEDSEDVLPVGYDGYNSSGTGSCVLGSSRLKTLYLGRDLSYESAKSYGYSPFYDCDSLTTVEVGDYVTEIGENLFRDCAKLTNVEFSKNTTSIGSYALYACTSLTSITIPANVANIGNYAFYDCDKIKNIYVKSKTPATIGGNYAFYDQYYDTIYVPKGTKDVYKAADYWKNFRYMMEADYSIRGDVDDDGVVDVADVTTIVDIVLNGNTSGDGATITTFDAWTSTNTSHSSTSQNSYTLNVVEGSVLTFDWKVSSGSDDYLIVTLDGIQILKKDTQASGCYEYIFDADGTHTLVAKYVKNDWYSGNYDRGEIYNIKITTAQSIKGDIDGDGIVDVADVTTLVDIILTGKTSGGFTPIIPPAKETAGTAIDLGLPSGFKWASYNVGATSPKERGGYYTWGGGEELESYASYDYPSLWNGNKYGTGSSDSPLTKYCTDSSYGTVDNKTNLEPKDDVARIKWGGSWRMPTKEDFEELIKYCTWSNDYDGYHITGPNGKSIFLPFTASGINGWACYWTSTLSSYSDRCAYNLGIYYTEGVELSYYYKTTYDNRTNGFSIRPVCE